MFCHYLFGSNANEIFEYLPLPKGLDKTAFVERCLDLSMKVHVFLFTHREGILLLDPRAYNKQCQLYALKVCQIQRSYAQKTEEEKLALTEENRFLHLAFFIHYLFREKKTYINTVLSTLRRMDCHPFCKNFTLKSFKRFLRDEDRSREKASRLSFNQIFEREIKRSLQLSHSPLQSELSRLSEENLYLGGTSLGVQIEKLYTYPKLAGLVYLVDAMAQERLHFVLKVKVVNQIGYGGMIRYASGSIGENDPVIIFSGFATDGSCSVIERMHEAKKCPSYLYRNIFAKTRHPGSQRCFYCTPTKIDLHSQQERLNRIMSSPNALLFALGAEFMEQEQKSLLPFFTDRQKYPQLSQLFDESLAKIKKLELETEHIRSLAIYHTYSEIGKRALSDEFALDFNPDQFLLKHDFVHKREPKLDPFCKDIFSRERTYWKMEPLEARDFINKMIFAIEGEKQEVQKVEEIIVRSADRTTPIRLYMPTEENKHCPVILFIHGGAFVGGNLDTHDNLARYLCKHTKALVVSVGYANAPEGKFPLPLEQCYEALLWIDKNGNKLQVDKRRLAVVGDSAGGNLAAALTLLTRNRKGPTIHFQLLINPVTDLTCKDPQGDTLDEKRWLANQYGANAQDIENPYVSPIIAQDLSGLPRALIIVAERDRLREEGEKYANRLIAAGVPTNVYMQYNCGHLAGNGARVSVKAKESLDVAVAALRGAFTKRTRTEKKALFSMHEKEAYQLLNSHK